MCTHTAPLLNEVRRLSATIESSAHPASTELSATPFASGRAVMAAPLPPPLVEASTEAIMSLWTGGRTRLLHATPLLDAEVTRLD